MHLWTALNRPNWYVRQPVKAMMLGLTVLAVSYPYPTLLIRHVSRLRAPNAMVDPDAPRLGPLVAELEPEVVAAAESGEQLRIVEAYVLRRVPYAFDWETWGVADYLPTVNEVLDQGREDCDGRAVLAASLLRKMGFEANLVTDGAHVWVWTPKGETMGPNDVKTIEATEDGLRVNWSGLRIMPRAIAYSIAVFPLVRELIVVAVIWLLLVRPGVGRPRGVCMAALLIAGLFLVRHSGASWTVPRLWVFAAGAAAMAGAVVVGARCVPTVGKHEDSRGPWRDDTGVR